MGEDNSPEIFFTLTVFASKEMGYLEEEENSTSSSMVWLQWQGLAHSPASGGRSPPCSAISSPKVQDVEVSAWQGPLPSWLPVIVELRWFSILVQIQFINNESHFKLHYYK